jgi:hypothetical protein
MIETICVPLLFVALIINVPTLIAYLWGLKFQINDFNCPEEVRDVKQNILLTKIVQGINVAVMLALIILLSLV